MNSITKYSFLFFLCINIAYRNILSAQETNSNFENKELKEENKELKKENKKLKEKNKDLEKENKELKEKNKKLTLGDTPDTIDDQKELDSPEQKSQDSNLTPPPTDEQKESNDKDTKEKQPKEKNTQNQRKAYIGLGESKPVGKQKKNYNADIYQYDPITNLWTKVTTGRTKSSAIVVKNTAYIGLGQDPGDPTKNMPPRYHDDFYKYDIKNNKWYKFKSFPQILRYNYASYTKNDKMYLGIGNFASKEYKNF